MHLLGKKRMMNGNKNDEYKPEEVKAMEKALSPSEWFKGIMQELIGSDLYDKEPIERGSSDQKQDNSSNKNKEFTF